MNNLANLYLLLTLIKIKKLNKILIKFMKKCSKVKPRNLAEYLYQMSALRNKKKS